LEQGVKGRERKTLSQKDHKKRGRRWANKTMHHQKKKKEQKRIKIWFDLELTRKKIFKRRERKK